MNPSELSGMIGLGFLLLFLLILIAFMIAGRQRPGRYLRDLPAFLRLGKAIGLAVEAGQRLHVTLGRGSLNGLQGPAAFIGLAILRRITRAASVSDRPPVATSGDGSLAVLSQDTLRGSYRSMGVISQYEPTSAQLTGLTPFAYAAGTLPLIYDESISANVLAGHFGSEAALITDAMERKGSFSLGGSDSLPAQAVLYATVTEPLIGEELYAAGAYTQAGLAHVASLRTQDVFRWVLVGILILGSVLKVIGVL